MKTKQTTANTEHRSMMLGAIQEAVPVLQTVTMLLNTLVDEAYSRAGNDSENITLGQSAVESIANTLCTVYLRLEQAEAGPGAESTKAA